MGFSDRLGVALYMLGAEMKADPRATLSQTRSIGYLEVEASLPLAMSPQAFASELEKLGLACPSLHVPLDSISPDQPSLSRPDSVIPIAKAIGASNVVIPVPCMDALLKRPDAAALLADPVRLGSALVEAAQAMTADDWTRLARRLNEAGALLARAGIRLGYHNHNLEFAPLPNGEPAIELLIALTDPALVDLEVDVGWAAAAGVDPAGFLTRHGPRVGQVHLKDLKAAAPNTTLRLATAQIGEGAQAWPAILDALGRTAARHVYVEQEPPHRVSGLRSAAEAYGFIHPRLAAIGSKA
jgi:sugar phosphate isomerase/epimerase